MILPYSNHDFQCDACHGNVICEYETLNEPPNIRTFHSSTIFLDNSPFETTPSCSIIEHQRTKPFPFRHEKGRARKEDERDRDDEAVSFGESARKS